MAGQDDELNLTEFDQVEEDALSFDEYPIQSSYEYKKEHPTSTDNKNSYYESATVTDATKHDSLEAHGQTDGERIPSTSVVPNTSSARPSPSTTPWPPPYSVYNMMAEEARQKEMNSASQAARDNQSITRVVTREPATITTRGSCREYTIGRCCCRVIWILVVIALLSGAGGASVKFIFI